MGKTFKHISQAERYEIKILLGRGYSLSKIAGVMGRSKSSISDEISRNKRSDSDLSRYGVKGEYLPKVANHKAYVRRRYARFTGMKIVSNPGLRRFIDKSLLDLQSPEAIAGRLRLGIDGERDKRGILAHSLPSVSRSTIEKYLHSSYGEAIRFEINTRQKLFRRRTRRKVSPKLDGRKFIDERPEVITKRDRIGDLEVDFIVSGRGGSGSLVTATDRRSRVSFVRKLWPVTAEGLTQILIGIKQEYPELMSITTDNDILFYGHKRLEALLEVPIYFCHPYSSWEKGSVENLNKYIRKFIRKGSNIAAYSRKLIQEVEGCANSRYMKVLGYLMPSEVRVNENNSERRC